MKKKNSLEREEKGEKMQKEKNNEKGVDKERDRQIIPSFK